MTLVPYMGIQREHFTVYPLFPLKRPLATAPPSIPTDDPHQPRFNGEWPSELIAPPLAIDPRRHTNLPAFVPFDQLNVSADDGLSANSTPVYEIWGETHYSFVATADADAVYVAQYGENNLRTFPIKEGALSAQSAVRDPISEFYGLGGSFSTAVAPDRTLYLSYDGAPGKALVRALSADGTEHVVVRGLTSPKQMTVDPQNRLYIVDEGAASIYRFDPAVCREANASIPGCWSVLDDVDISRGCV